MAFLRAVASFLAPTLPSLGAFLFFNLFHYVFYYSAFPGIGPLAVLSLFAIILGEYWFTRRFEGPRFQSFWLVWPGFIGRIGVLLGFWYLFLGVCLSESKTADIVTPLVSKGPFVFRLSLTASPFLSVLCLLFLTTFYALLTLKYRVLRMTTTLLLPGLATLGLFNLYYHAPGWAEATSWQVRPDFVEKVFPAPSFVGSGRFSNPYPREIAVAPDDSHAFLTYGNTFGSQENRGSFVFLDFVTGEWVTLLFPRPIRRIATECPSTVYFGPWGGGDVFSFEAENGSLERFQLPPSVNGLALEENMFFLNACDENRVYIAHDRNPVLFVWDSHRDHLEATVNLVENEDYFLGDSFWVLARNSRREVLYLLFLARYQLAELDERTLTITRKIALPHDGFDILVDASGRYLYIPAFFKEEIWKIDAESLAVTATWPAPLHCRRIAFDQEGRFLFAASYITGQVKVFDAATGKGLREFYVSRKLEGMSVSCDFLYLSAYDGLYRIPLSEF